MARAVNAQSRGSSQEVPAVWFWRRRAGTQWWLRWALGAVVLVVVVGVTVSVGVAARQPDRSVRDRLTESSADDNSMVWKRLAATNASAQDVATRAQLHRELGGAPILIFSTATGDALPLAEGSKVVLPLRDEASLRASTSGMPVVGRGEVAIDDVGARNLRVAVGDTLSLQTAAGIRDLKVAAIWHVTDARSPIWNGIGPGAVGTSGRVVLSTAELSADHVPLTARWSIAPDPARIRATDLPAVGNGFARLEAEVLKSDDFAAFDGGGAGTVTALRRGIAAAAAVVPISIALLAVGALLAMLLLVRLVAEVRTGETALLRARGASRRQLVEGDVRSALTPVVGAAVLGGLVTQLLLLPLVAPPSGWAEIVLPIVLPALAALIAVVAASWTATSERQSGRAVRVAGAAGVALLLIVTVVAAIRLGTAGVGDLASQLAPGLVIAVLVVIGLLFGAPVTAAADSAVHRRDGVSAPLATSRLRQRPGLVAGAFVLAAFAIGSSAFAASAIPSSSGFIRDGGRLASGGDVAVYVAGADSLVRGSSPADVASLSRTARADASSPAVVEPVDLGSVAATLAAAPSTRLSGLQNSRVADLAGLAPVVGQVAGIPLTGSGGGSLRAGVEVEATSAPADLRVEVTVWIAQPDNGVARLDLPAAALGTATVEARLPAGQPGRVVAVEASVQSSAAVVGLHVKLHSLAQVDARRAVSNVRLPTAGWALTKAIAAPAGVTASDGIGWTASGDLAGDGERGERIELGRLMPAGATVIPVALSRDFAAAVGLEVGGHATLEAWDSLPIQVVALVPQTIGSENGPGVWADLPTLQTVLLRLGPDVRSANHVWLAVPDPRAAADRLAARYPADEVTESPAAAFAPFAQPVTVGTFVAAAGSLLFALLAIVVVVASLMRDRRAEISVLRALGMGERTQRVTARIELVGVLGYALVVGAVAAVVAAVVTVPSLSHAVAPGVATVADAPVVVDLIILGVAILVLAVGALIGLLVQERLIARLAVRPGAEVER